MLVLILILVWWVHSNSFIFSPKTFEKSLSFICNSLFNYNNMEMVIHSQLAKIGPSSLKIWRMQVPWDKSVYFLILLGFNDNKVLLKYFYIFVFCSGRAFQRYIDNGNPTGVSDIASESIFTASDLWTVYRAFIWSLPSSLSNVFIEKRLSS